MLYVGNAVIGQCSSGGAGVFCLGIFVLFGPAAILFRWAEMSASGTFVGPDAPWATEAGNGAVERVL